MSSSIPMNKYLSGIKHPVGGMKMKHFGAVLFFIVVTAANVAFLSVRFFDVVSTGQRLSAGIFTLTLAQAFVAVFAGFGTLYLLFSAHAEYVAELLSEKGEDKVS